MHVFSSTFTIIIIGVERSISGGDHIHIFVFTDHKNNLFQNKLLMQNTNI